MSKIIKNKSKTYLLPLLSEIIDFDQKYYNNLINTYIYDDLDMYKDCIFIQHKFSFKNPEYTNYEHRLISNELYVDLIDIDDDNVVYIFKFPKEYLIEYKLFKLGKYSKFGQDAKELILDFFGTIYKGNINAVTFLIKIKHILFRDIKLKRKLEKELNVKISNNAELSSIIDKENETFNLSKYIKKNNDKNKDKNIIS